MEIVIALIPALAWGINPTVVGKIGGKPIQQQLGTALGALIFAIGVFLFMHPAITVPLIIGCGISGLLWSLGQLLQYKSYQLLGTSKAFAISTGFNLIFNSLFGVIVFKEWNTTTKLLLGFGAIAVIIVGAVLTSYSENKEDSDLKNGIIILIIAAISFTAYSCAPRFVNAGGIEAVFPQAIGMIAGSLILSLFEPKDIKKFGSMTMKHMIPGLIWSIANITLIYSNLYNGVAVGFTLSQMCVVVSTICSLLFLNENKSKKELRNTILGVVLVTIGCILIGCTKI